MIAMKLLDVILVLCNLLTLSWAYSTYQTQIPNGNNIPHPCKANYRWQGVGHKTPGGGGPRNVFGLDFAKQNHVYTKELCSMDSDGDGRTNGEELGDPGCKWTPGSVPERTDNLSHPGVCEPMNSTLCQGKNDFVSCELDRFEACDAIKQPDVKTIEFRFPKTKIPPKDTNYLCMTFDLPSDQDYHVIASEPIIDNANVLHHMLLFGCESPDDLYLTSPQPCGMSSFGKCGSTISGWTVGSSGGCFGNNTGFRVGNSSFQRVRLEIHYNNPTLSPDFVDSSGLRIYYQPAKPGVQDLTVFTVGQMVLEIPPGKNNFQHVAVCPSNCSRFIIKEPAYVIATNNHMHYLGSAGRVEVYRNGKFIINLSNDSTYSYDSPVEHVQSTPFQLLPGDDIITTCEYNSLSSKRYVYFGEATSDEMCFGFITLYPPSALRNNLCVSFGSMSMCDIYNGNPIGQCDWVSFTNFTTNTKIINDVMKNCNLNGFCRPECLEVLKSLESHPCLNGEANNWVTSRFEDTKEGLEFLARLRSCPRSSNCTDGSSQTPSTTPASVSVKASQFGGNSSTQNAPAVYVMLVLLISSVALFL